MIQAGIRARWCIDIRYGFKLDAVALMQEWVQDIGSQAGLSPSNARINSGAVGVPESRLELEVEFNSFAELEDFWAAIPATDHKAWSQRMQNLVVHGSPAWEVYRTCPLPVASAYGEETTAASSSLLVPPSASTPPPPSSDGTGGYGGRGRPRSGDLRRLRGLGQSGAPSLLLEEPSPEDVEKYALHKASPEAGSDQGAASGSSAAEGSGAGDEQVVLDWKGEPMKINPGDKLPFRL